MLTAEDQEAFDNFKADLLATLEWVKMQPDVTIMASRWGIVWDLGTEPNCFQAVPIATATIQACAVCLLGAHVLRLQAEAGGSFQNPYAFQSFSYDLEQLRADNGPDASPALLNVASVLDPLLGLSGFEIESFTHGFDDEPQPGWAIDEYYSLGQELRPLALATNAPKETP